MKKAIIVCWFGPIPTYYKLWEYSCGKNEKFDFLVFTDQNIKSIYNNIKIYKFKMDELKEIIEKKLNISLCFTKAYKFCDLRPAYGVIFDDYLKNYDYWGHCDLDQIFGNISKFLPDELISKYEKINHNGHFVLYKNNEKMNNMFKNSGSHFDWREVFSSNENYAFDEYSGINMICKSNYVKELYVNDFADIDKRYKRYRAVNHNNWKKQAFVYSKGEIYRYICLENNVEKKEEFFYLHFQKKVPMLDDNLDFNQTIIIGSTKLGNVDEINKNTIVLYNPPKATVMELMELGRYYFKKLKEYITSSKKMKKIKINQKKKK